MRDEIAFTNSKLVDAQGLLEELFSEECRPSLRWVREMQRRRKIPYIKIGHLVRFDVECVRRSLAENYTIMAR